MDSIDFMSDESQATANDLRRWFSSERMRRYEESAVDPVALYVWNTRMSKAYLEDIAHVEVMLRNFIAARLSAACGCADWYEQIDFFGFDYEFRKAVDRVKKRIHCAGHDVTPDRVIAGLSLDSWRFLLVRKLEPTVWKALRDQTNGGMPHYKSRRRREFEAHVIRLLDMRNRCSHQEPLIQQNPVDERDYLDAQWENLLWLADVIDPKAGDWIRGRSRVPELRKIRPIRTVAELSALPNAKFMAKVLESDQMVELILDGTRTAAASPLHEYLECGSPLPRVGSRSVLTTSSGRNVAVLITDAIEVIHLSDMDDRQIMDENECDDDTPVVLVHFEVAERL